MRTSNSKHLTRTLQAGAFTIVLAMTITACTGKESKVTTARENRDTVVEFVMNTTKQLDIAGWWPRNGVAWATECGQDGAGAAYSYESWAPQGSDHFEDAKRIAAYWESLGMRVRMVNADTSPTLFAEGGPVLRASFDTHSPENSYSVGAFAYCAPGDWDALNMEDQKLRESGETLPGDEGLIIREDPRETWKTPPETVPDSD